MWHQNVNGALYEEKWVENVQKYSFLTSIRTINVEILFLFCCYELFFIEKESVIILR